jgi:PAS domain S-box-containing protein
MDIANLSVTKFLDTFKSLGIKFSDLETDLLIVVDGRGRMVRVFPGFTAALGYTEADVLGWGIMRIIDARDMPAFIKSFTWPDRKPFRMFHKDGGEVWVKLENWDFADEQQGLLIIRKIERD